MHKLDGHPVWLGHAGDLADVRGVLDAGIRAVVDLALNEPVRPLPRDLVYCRFPLVDGVGNNPWLLLVAIQSVAGLMALEVPTLVVCSAGLSRSHAIVAAALSHVSARAPEECLETVSSSLPSDVNPGLWNEVAEVCRAQSLQAGIS